MRPNSFNRYALSVLLLTLGLPQLFAGEPNVQELLITARVQFFDKDYEASLATFDKALSKDPDNLEAQLGKMDSLGALRRSVESLDKSVSGKQTTPNDALILGANQKIWSRDFDGALSDLKKAIQKDPKAYMAHYLAAFLERRKRNFDEALSHLNKAFELAPEFPETSYLLGDVYLAKGDTDKALRAYQRYLEMVPAKGKRYESVSDTIRRIGGR